MKKKIVMALLVGSLAAVTPAVCFAAETDAKAEETSTDAAEADGEEADEEEETEETDAADTETDEKKEEKTVGEKTEDCITFRLKNSTTKKITGVAIKTSEDAEFPENMMEEGDSFELKEKKKIFFTKAGADTEAADTAEASEDKAPTYDLHITFEDETTADVHGVALENLGTLVIREKEGIVYGTYKQKSDKEKVSTLETEKAIAAEETAAAEAAAAEAAAQQQTQSYDYSYDYSDDYSYDYSGDDYSGGNDYSGGDDGGSGDGCLDNGLLG